MDVTLVVNGRDFSKRLSTYSITEEVTYKKVVKTLDGVEHATKEPTRPIITFSLLPSTDEESAEDYRALAPLFVNATYTRNGADEPGSFRVVSNLESTFLLLSVDGKRRYKGGHIQLRRI